MSVSIYVYKHLYSASVIHTHTLAIITIIRVLRVRVCNSRGPRLLLVRTDVCVCVYVYMCVCVYVCMYVVLRLEFNSQAGPEGP